MGKKLIIKAAVFAAEKHKYQRRKGFNQVPYINHPLEVAEVLVNSGEDDEAVIVAALLHDVIEDTDATAPEIEQEFGRKVSGLVLELTDDKNLPIAVRKELQVKKAPDLSVNAKKIKIADKICNIRDMVNYPMEWTLERRLGYLEWAEQVVAGCRGVHPELESLFDVTVSDGRAHFQTDLS